MYIRALLWGSTGSVSWHLGLLVDLVDIPVGRAALVKPSPGCPIVLGAILYSRWKATLLAPVFVASQSFSSQTLFLPRLPGAHGEVIGPTYSFPIYLPTTHRQTLIFHWHLPYTACSLPPSSNFLDTHSRVDRHHKCGMGSVHSDTGYSRRSM
jgi:hypothetical protein